MITLTVDGDDFTLPSQLNWIDEFDYTPMEASYAVALDGSPIIFMGLKKASRDLTLSTPEGGDWISRGDLDALYATLSTVTNMTLTLHDARQSTVVWKHNETPIEAIAVRPGIIEANSSNQYILILRFIIIE